MRNRTVCITTKDKIKVVTDKIKNIGISLGTKDEGVQYFVAPIEKVEKDRLIVLLLKLVWIATLT